MPENKEPIGIAITPTLLMIVYTLAILSSSSNLWAVEIEITFVTPNGIQVIKNKTKLKWFSKKVDENRDKKLIKNITICSLPKGNLSKKLDAKAPNNTPIDMQDK